MLKRVVRLFHSVVPESRSIRLNRRLKEPQPSDAAVTVAFTIFTKAGANANGKLTAYRFLPDFCDVLRRNQVATVFVSSKRKLDRVLRNRAPVVIIHLFGEDNEQIASAELDALEAKALGCYNGSRTGLVLSDKLSSHRAFLAAGVPVPKILNKGGFVRERMGSGRPATLLDKSGPTDSETHISTEFVDTRVEFKDRSYFTTIRLVCVDDVVIHAIPRARDAKDGDACVHAEHTPMDPALIEHLHSQLVEPRMGEFSKIAQKLFATLGHGFYAHDILLDRDTGATLVCESGFKFDNPVFWMRMEPIASEIPSQAVQFPVESFARTSAEAFLLSIRRHFSLSF